MEQKNKFGSTPLFNIPPAPPISNASATTRPTNGKFAGPTSYSCHEVKNGYAIPNGMPNNNCSTFNTENFYAATDIVLKVIDNLQLGILDFSQILNVNIYGVVKNRTRIRKLHEFN